MAAGKSSTEELKSLTVTELKALAKKHGLQLGSSLKADIVKELARALKPTVKTTKKPVKKTTAKKKPARAEVKKKTPATAKRPATKTTGKKAAPRSPAAPSGTGALASLTVSELRDMARKNSITLKGSLKADIVRELEKALKPSPKPAKKAPVKTKAAASAKTAEPKALIREAAPSAPAPSKRTTLPVGTVPPRAPAPRDLAKKIKPSAPEKPKPWVPKTPAETSPGNWASAIPVEPGRIFVSWDVLPETLNPSRRLVLRVMDVTESDIHSSHASGSYIQVPVRTMSGGMFINVSVGHRYEVIVGTMGMAGDFRPLVTTETVSTPNGGPSEGASLLEEEHFQFGPAKGRKPSSR